MKLKPAKPVKLEQLLIFEETKANRFVFCPLYHECLLKAAHWPSFTCTQCENFKNHEEILKFIMPELLEQLKDRMLCSIFEYSINITPNRSGKRTTSLPMISIFEKLL